MKKIIKFLSVIILLQSCSSDNDTYGVSKITNYPVFKLIDGITPLENAPSILVQQDSNFTVPEINVTENGVVIPYQTSIKSDYRGFINFDTKLSDRYIYTYKATNKDGFSASSNRAVWVYKTGDFINSLEGLYLSTVKRNGSLLPAGSTDLKYILIWKNTDGSYGVSDAIGGWYELARGLGVDYASKGLIFTINDIATNNYTITKQANGVGIFGGSANTTSIVANQTNKTIVIKTDVLIPTAFSFEFTLTQVP